MTYGCLAWDTTRKNELIIILKLQHQAVRIMTFSDFSEPTSIILETLHHEA